MGSTSSLLSANDVVGAERPRVSSRPEYVSSAGVEAVELARLAGLDLDPWQQFVLEQSLGERADGKWAAFEVGLVVPRQNGKGSILEARELAGLFLFGEKLLIHSAHEQATSSEHFRRLKELIEGVPEFERRVLKAPQGKGAEAIELRGGQRILFKTRTAGGGRGLTGDLVVLDEAMILPEAVAGALVPTMAARSVHGNPQLWYAGSAVDKQRHEHGVVLARVRERGLAGAARVAYFDWSAEGDDPGNVPDDVRSDPEVWAQANPGMGIRIAAEHIENESAGALGPREFAVERLGIGDWPRTDGTSSQIISDVDWLALVDHRSEIVGPVSVTFDVRPDRSMSAIAAAGLNADGRHHVEIIDHLPGTGWLVPRLVGVAVKHGAEEIVFDAAGPAGSLELELREALEETGIELRPVTAREHAEAYGQFIDAVDQDGIRHLGTPELASAIKGAVRRSLGDAFAWSRKGSAVDISPLVACTLALWGVESRTPAYDGPLVEWA